jgi:hypothetical protein
LKDSEEAIGSIEAVDAEKWVKSNTITALRGVGFISKKC